MSRLRNDPALAGVATLACAGGIVIAAGVYKALWLLNNALGHDAR